MKGSVFLFFLIRANTKIDLKETGPLVFFDFLIRAMGEGPDLETSDFYCFLMFLILLIFSLILIRAIKQKKTKKSEAPFFVF